MILQIHSRNLKLLKGIIIQNSNDNAKIILDLLCIKDLQDVFW